LVLHKLGRRFPERRRPSFHQGTTALSFVLAVFDRIISALAHGDRVELRGFGAFTVSSAPHGPDATREPGMRCRWPRGECHISGPAGR
jgi:hypothetical protein